MEWVWLIHFSGSSSRSRAVWSTWARRLDPRVAIVAFGRPVPEHLPPSVITVAYQDMMPWPKTLEAFRRAWRLYPRATYFSKFDDDTYVYSKNLHHALFDTTETRIPYGGYPLRAADGTVFASGGAGYSLHRSVMGLLDQCLVHGLSEYEDVAMRKCLGMDPVDLVGTHPHHPWQMLRWDLFGHSPDHVRRQEPDNSYTRPLTYHYMGPEEMERMHDDWHVLGSASNRRNRGIPKVIHQYWEGGRKPPAQLLDSCRGLHPGWNYSLWNTEQIKAKFPSGELVNQVDYMFPRRPLHCLADIARYELLLFYGGVYIDADTRCLVPLDSLWQDFCENVSDGFGAYESETRTANIEGYNLVATGVLALHPYSPTAMLLVKHLHQTDWSLDTWRSTGPLYVTKILAQKKLPLTILPSRLFYPFHHLDKRPDTQEEIEAYLKEKGALTDQLWGTSHDSYS